MRKTLKHLVVELADREEAKELASSVQQIDDR
jgi:hypothetical protein